MVIACEGYLYLLQHLPAHRASQMARELVVCHVVRGSG